MVIISFVIFFSPDAALRGGFSGDYGSIYDHPITREQFMEARREVELQMLFRLGTWLGHDAFSRQFLDRLDDEVRQRLLLIEKLDQLHILVSDEAAAQWISNLPIFRDPRSKAFSQDRYNNFIKQFLPSSPNVRLEEADFDRYVRHAVGIQQLAALFGLSGELVTPRDAEAQYRHEHEEAVAEAAFVSATNFVAGVKADPVELALFYTNRLAVYRIPERVQVSYVKFAASNHLAQADEQLAKEANLNQKLDEIYLEQGPSFFKDANDQPLPEAAAKAKIKQRLRDDLALQAARKSADEFAARLFKLSPARPENLNQLAAKAGLVVRLTQPFTQSDGFKEIGLETFNKAAFGLTEEEPFTASIKGEDGVYLIAFHKRFPSEIPSLDSIREQVTADYRRYKALQLAREAGERFHNTFTNGLPQGQSFHALCVAARVEWVKLPPFSLSTSSLPEIERRADMRELQNVAFTLRPNAVSDFARTPDGGFVLYLQKLQPADEAKLKAELPGYLASLRKARLEDAFDEWLRREYTLAHLSAPGAKAKAN